MDEDEAIRGPGTVVDKAAPTGPTNSKEWELLTEIAGHYNDNPNVIGGGDILAFPVGKPVARAGMVAALLAGIMHEGGERVIRRAVVVIPPGGDVSDADCVTWSSFKRTFRLLAGRPLEQDEKRWFRDWLTVQVSTNGRHANLLALIGEQAERTAIIVVQADGYRDDAIAPYVPDGARLPQITEDVWAPQVHALAVAATAYATERQLYVLMDVNKIGPIRPDLADVLHSIDSFGVLGSSADESFEAIISRRAGIWEQWIAGGRVGRALSDVDALPPIIDPQKPILKVQLLHKAGLNLEAVTMIRSEILARINLDPSTCVLLGRIAADAGAARLAGELIEPCINVLEIREDLESAFRTFEHRDQELAARIALRLEARFTGSECARRHQRNQLLRDRNYANLAELLREEDLPRSAFYAHLAEAFAGTGTPNYIELIQSAETTDLSDDYRLASVQDALARGFVLETSSLILAIPKSTAQVESWEGLALQVLESSFLQAGPDGEPVAGIDAIRELLLALIGRLAANPMNANLRIGIVDALKPEVAGMKGLALIAKLVIDLAGRPVAIDKGVQGGSAGEDKMIEHSAFLHCALDWLEAENPIVIGKLALPPELLTVSADEAISVLSSLIAHKPSADETDILAVQLFTTLAAAIAPHAVDPDIDLRLYRHAAGKFVSSNFAQAGRDLVEAAVQAGTATPRRRRLAWFAVADTYHRTGDHLTALVALACALAADDHAEEEDLWQEVYLMARLLRDIGLHDESLTMVTIGRELLERRNLAEAYGHWLDLLSLQVRIARRDCDDPTELANMLAMATTIGRTVLDRGYQSAPSDIALGQLIRDAHDRDVYVPEETDMVFAELNKSASGTLEAMIDATAASMPTAAQLARLVTAIPPSRYAQDVGYDMANIAALAQRSLTNETVLEATEDVSFLLELQADQGTALPNWDDVSAPPAKLEQGQPAAIARTISDEGVDVLQLGFDANGRLIRLATSNAELGAPTAEDEEMFSRTVFNNWLQRYPYCYGFDSSPNLFYRTTKHLQLGWLAERSTIVAASTVLQSFPPTILNDGNEFLGRTAAVAAVPSLAWLSGAHERNYKGDGRRVAWLSTAEEEDGRSTFSLLAQRLDGLFANHGFEFDNGSSLPEHFASASMAVLTAHGGVHPEGRFFQLVADEGVLKVSASELAMAVRNVGIVILFVCSGGRADKHPMANTVLGLAKQILDRGCSAVVASPWPLDSQLPPHWLKAFLPRWEVGDRLMDATFAANQAVDKRFSLDPARGLAMITYGNGLLTKP